MNTPQSPSPVALLTDFGTEDTYVGTMKGVILRLCPGAPLIDLTHQIGPQNVPQAAFALWTAYRYFPNGTVFLVVVDPGVGSARRPVAVETDRFRFVGPDNGVFSEVLVEVANWQAVAIDETLAVPEGITATFHGRDLFAPAAARLACGQSLAELGAPLDTLITLSPPHLKVTHDTIEGEIIYIDHFGNAVTSIGLCRWQPDGTLCLTPRLQGNQSESVVLAPGTATVTVGQQTFSGIARTYTAVRPGQATPLINSAGQLEIAVNQGSARDTLGLSIGERIVVRLGS